MTLKTVSMVLNTCRFVLCIAGVVAACMRAGGHRSTIAPPIGIPFARAFHKARPVSTGLPVLPRANALSEQGFFPGSAVHTYDLFPELWNALWTNGESRGLAVGGQRCAVKTRCSGVVFATGGLGDISIAAVDGCVEEIGKIGKVGG